MAGKKVSDFEQMLLRSAEQAVAIARGEAKPAHEEMRTLDARDVEIAPPPTFDAKRVQLVRKNMNLSQPVFAELLNVSVSLVRAWERGAREPEGASQRLLQVAESKASALVQDVAFLNTRNTWPTQSKSLYSLRERANTALHAKPATVHTKRKRGAR